MSLRFAMVTDTHVGLDPAGPAARLSRVYAAVARRAPDFVLHCGDITDTGLPGEYDRYQQAVPGSLRPVRPGRGHRPGQVAIRRGRSGTQRAPRGAGGPGRLHRVLRGRAVAVDAADGRLAWSVPGRGFSAGRAACDGERVYSAAADGYARAHDLRTGREAWSREMVSGDRHRVALYSGWDVVTLGAGVVVVATVSGSQALDPATGTLRWAFPGSTMYPPAVVLGDGTALLTTERGVVSRVRLADGGTIWQVSLGVRVQNAGLAVAGASAWVVSEDGRLVRVRLADGREQGSVRLTSAGCYCAPAVAGDTLIAGDQDGLVHGIRLPPGPVRG